MIENISIKNITPKLRQYEPKKRLAIIPMLGFSFSGSSSFNNKCSFTTVLNTDEPKIDNKITKKKGIAISLIICMGSVLTPKLPNENFNKNELAKLFNKKNGPARAKIVPKNDLKLRVRYPNDAPNTSPKSLTRLK